MTKQIQYLLSVFTMALSAVLSTPTLSAVPMKIFGGEWASLYINDLGDLYFNGDVGWDGGTSTTLPPKLLMSSVKDASNGSGQTLIVKFDDSLWVMGRNDFGQLGTGNTNALTSPVKIADGVKAVSAGTWHSLYLTTGGVAMAMGRNNYPFGDGSTSNRYTPVQIMTGIKAISAGVRHSLYLKEDGTAWAVGSNWEGGLGDGTINARSTPYQVMSNVAAISAGDNYSIFVKTDGSVWVCGKGQDGRLGTGNTSNQLYPVQVLTGCVDAFAERGYGNSTTWFLKSDGNVYACGYNASGQIGDGTTSGRLSPVKVAVANNIRSISRGLFLDADGLLWASGTHSVGASTPVNIIDLSPAAGSAPTVQITAPASGGGTPPAAATATLGSQVFFAANATDNIAVSAVNFYADGILIGAAAKQGTTNSWVLSKTLSGAPFSTKGAGSYAITAIASDADLNQTQSAVTTLAVTSGTAGTAPTGSLVFPAAASVQTLGQAVALQALASDVDGAIASVAFYANGVLVDTDASAPFTGTWTPTVAGSYNLVLVITDAQGATTVTAPVMVTVNQSASPSVSLVLPVVATTLTVGSDLPLVATASDLDGTIASVGFYADGALVATGVRVGNSTTYTATWTPTVARSGAFKLTVKATDNAGLVTETAPGLNVTVNVAPVPPMPTPITQTPYFWVEGTYTWAEAFSDAATRGGRLAVLNTQNKVNAAYGYLTSLALSGSPRIWIGLSDAAQEGQWKWITGAALTYSDWYSGEPNNGNGNEHYCEMWYDYILAGLAGWNDLPGTFRASYLLEALGPIILTQPIGQTVNFGGSTTLSVVATASGTPTYQWRKNGVDIQNSISASLALNNVQMADAGSYTVVVTWGDDMTSDAAVVTVTAPVSWTLFNAAETALAVVDTGLVTLSPIEKISVVTGAAAHAAGDALKLQAADGSSTYAERTIQGPAVVTFAWRVSSEEDFDFLSYSIDGDVQESISGNGAWLERSLLLDTGTHTLRWTYAKDSADANFDDAGYLDDLVVLPAFEDLQVKSGSTVLTGNSTLSFGTVQEQATALTQTLDLKNTGTIQMAVSASLPADSGFVFEDQTLSAALVLEPGATQALRLVLTTTVPGTKSALLTLTAAGSQTPPPAITLTGFVQALTPAITCSWSGGGLTNGQGTAVDFGTTPSDRTFTINDTGTGALAIASVSVSPSADFQVIYPPAATVAIGGNTTFTLRASETTRGTHSATVTIASNAGNAPSFSFPVTSLSYLAVTGTGFNNGSFANNGTNAGWSTVAATLPGGGTGQALKAGSTPDNGHSTIGATFDGPGLLRWNWEVSAQANYDWLVCEVNGVEVAGISTKALAWQSQVVQIPAGASVRWIYRKDAANTSGSDTAYISDIAFSKFSTTQTTFASWSAAHGDLSPLEPLPALGHQAMFAWLGGLDPAVAPAADHYTPMVSGGFYKYRYRVAKSAAGRVQAEISNDLVTWSKRKMSQTLISEDANSAVIEVSAPTTTAVFSRLVAEQPASSMPDPSAFSLIPAGAFTMGNSVAADTDITDAPTRTVTLDAYYIGKYEVTKAEWDEVRTWALSNGYSDLAAGAGKASNHPVQTITWDNMVKWCNALSQKEGLSPVYYTDDAQTTIYKTGSVNVTNAQVKWSANGYRLPTEAEWEKAARGGLSGKRFPWGDTISHSQANYSASPYSSYDQSGGVNTYQPSYATGSEPFTAPVGAFAANHYGLSDMTGNIREWCWDWYGPYTAGSQTNPLGATSGSNRVLRGGGWTSDASRARVAVRPYYDPILPRTTVGFRVARSTGPSIYPTISEIADQSITAGSNTGALAFMVGDAQTAAASLTLSGSSGNTTLVPNSSIVFGGSGANRTVTVTPALGQTGTTTITVTVSDGSFSSSYTFWVTVRPALILINGGQLPANSSLPYQPVSTFYITKTETTLGEWQSVLSYALASGYDLPAGVGNGADYPVTNVSWYDAVKWCNARSEQEGLIPVYKVNDVVYKTGQSAPEVDSTATGYRLPLEAEWEFAARGGVNLQHYDYSGSFVINDVAWYNVNANFDTRQVETKQPNQLNLHDMSGNVMEWCQDWHFSNNYSSHRIVRGGSAYSEAPLCLVTHRDLYTPISSAAYLGFRVARSSVQ